VREVSETVGRGGVIFARRQSRRRREHFF